jgi:hypothetical protein
MMVLRRRSWFIQFFVWLLLAPVLLQTARGEAALLRKPIPVGMEDGKAVTAQYVAGLKRIENFWGQWAQYHNGFAASGSEDNCAHRSATFFVWHHAYLVLTEEMFSKALGAPFAMPYWSPAQGPTVPAVFSCVTGDCTVLADTNRFREANKSFEVEWSRWTSLKRCAEQSYFCRYQCDQVALDPLGGAHAMDNATSVGGWIESQIHDPVHDAAACPSAAGASCTPGTLSAPKKAALDPLFHPFHAGIDAGYVSFLKNSRITQEVCSAGFSSSEGATASWSSGLFELPEPQCLVYDENGKTFHFSASATYDDGKSCSDFAGSLSAGIPKRVFKIGEILREKRFWRVGYPGESSSEPIGVGQPCSGTATLYYQCPQIAPLVSRSLRRRPFWPDGARLRLNEDTIRGAYFRVSMKDLDTQALAKSEYQVSLKGRSGEIAIGNVRLTGWDQALRAQAKNHPEGPAGSHHNAREQVVMEILPEEAKQREIRALLSKGERVTVQFKPVGGEKLAMPRDPQQVYLEVFLLAPGQ